MKRVLDADKVCVLLVVITGGTRRGRRHRRWRFSTDAALKFARHVIAQRHHDNGKVVCVLQRTESVLKQLHGGPKK